MFTIEVETHFRAPHQLTLSDGSKEPPHTHDWSVIAQVSSEKLDSVGFVMDFGQFKAMVDKITAEFDNTQLDSIAYFRRNNPSAENVAKYIFDRLEPELPEGVKLRSVKVVEEPGCSAKFSK
ncbi:MAG: 6-carboxytetrahydropterin synthase [Sedimentisphaerales bacterium]|nr:6-carboxytetrahydropterin synthase [Sedimentisphaerales bacterium]